MIALPQGCRLVDLDVTASTNDDAKKLAQSGAPEGTVVRAAVQTAGRGRQGNVWDSRGGNLFMSLVLRPGTDAVTSGQVSFIAAVALARVFSSFGVTPALKWPNDILVDGKKAAGILLESELDAKGITQWVIVGIGVNIQDAPEGAASFSGLGVHTSRDAVLERLMREIMDLYILWRKDGFDAVRAAWLEYASGLGGDIRVRLPDEAFTGTFLGIDALGALQVRLADGAERRITSAEVFSGRT